MLTLMKSSCVPIKVDICFGAHSTSTIHVVSWLYHVIFDLLNPGIHRNTIIGLMHLTMKPSWFQGSKLSSKRLQTHTNYYRRVCRKVCKRTKFERNVVIIMQVQSIILYFCMHVAWCTTSVKFDMRYRYLFITTLQHIKWYHICMCTLFC